MLIRLEMEQFIQYLSLKKNIILIMFTPIFKLQSFHKNKGFFFYYNQRTNKTFLIFRFCVWQYANYGNTALRQYVNTALRQYGIISAWTILIKDGVIYYTAVLPNW